MENLAGNKSCDPMILRELGKAGIDVVVYPEPLRTEVPASVTGKLGEFTFRRAWYYWMVRGKVPLSVAKELYANPIGRETVRVLGNAGCPPPDEYAVHVDAQGKHLRPLSEENEIREMEQSNSEGLKKIAAEIRETSAFVQNPADEAVSSFVSIYHIDTQEGLNLFVETLRSHELIPEEKTSHLLLEE